MEKLMEGDNLEYQDLDDNINRNNKEIHSESVKWINLTKSVDHWLTFIL